MDSPIRAASIALWKRVFELVDEKWVAPSVIAAAMGVQPITIHAGMRRHGHRPNPPSQRSYRHVLTPTALGRYQKICKRGHPQEGENLGIVKGGKNAGRRYCKACARMKPWQRMVERGEL